jgi:uncharacterized protein YbaP (TraB family)
MRPLSRCAYYWLITLLITLGAASNLLLAADQEKGLLWQIDKTGLTPSYLFGTIHSDDPRVTKLPPVVRSRFEQADSVTIEVALTFSTAMKSLFSMYLKPGETLDKLIDKKKYEELVKVLIDYGVPEEATKRLKPLVTLIILSSPKSTTGQFLDLQLYQQAQALDKPVFGLETAEEQLALFDFLSLEEQVTLLKGSLKELAEIPAVLEKLHELYLQRDLSGLLKLNEESIKMDNHKELVEKFMKRLIVDRNLVMVERMQARLQEGNAFIAVGALHLPGKQGLLKLLEARGYRVSVLY